MRYLLVGLAARLGWAPPCRCHTAVIDSAAAHADAENEIRALRAENTRLRARLEAMAFEPLAVPVPREAAAAEQAQVSQ